MEDSLPFLMMRSSPPDEIAVRHALDDFSSLSRSSFMLEKPARGPRSRGDALSVAMIRLSCGRNLVYGERRKHRFEPKETRSKRCFSPSESYLFPF